jgi:iron complex outermembrane recepter protein
MSPPAPSYTLNRMSPHDLFAERRTRATATAAAPLVLGLAAVVLVPTGAPAAPAAAAESADPRALEDIVVTATRLAAHSFDLPVSIDRVDGRALRDGQFAVNLSEALGVVPGLSVQNRQNYAQDLQLSVRGFGARSSFGVRGVRLYADGIPGTMPDGQGQFSHFDLGGADRIEVMRGPFSALYGNSSGGVISIYTEDGRPGVALDGAAGAGSLSMQRYMLKASGDTGSTNFVVDAAHFETNGDRDHSRAERNTGNAKVRLALGEHSKLTLVANVILTPEIQDPLGLTRSQLAADPGQAGTNALAYNTRKRLQQEQGGAILTTALGEADELTLTAYDGRRETTQFQAIPKVAEANPLHPGGVIDLHRDYRGGDLHLTDRRAPGGTALTVTAGVAYDALEERRRGYLNYAGAALGAIGALRRDEANRVGAADEYVQLEWDPAARWRALAGVRHSDIEIRSRDQLNATTIPGDIRYSATDPIAGVSWRAADAVNVYASYGRGFETPTLNDLAYRTTDGTEPGLNDQLRPARSDNYEVGLKAAGRRLRADLAAFYISTHDELAVRSNFAGRSVFGNIDRTERRGAELAVTARRDEGFEARLAYTYLRADTRDPYQSCAGQPCVPVTVAAGSRLPAVPANSLYAGVTWRAPRGGFSTTIETVGRSQIYVDDRNSDAAAGYWTTNVRAGLAQAGDEWTVTETLRVDNVTDRRYVGTVIVNESNGRYFEPSLGRTAYLLISFSCR